MADYRAMNRNSKVVDARKKLAATFSTPSPKFTPAGRPGVVSTPNPVAGAGTNFLDQMAKRYTVNTVKGIKDVAVGTVKNNKSGLQNNSLVDPNSFFGRVLASAGPMGTAMNYTAGNALNNNAFNDAIAPTDFVGSGSLVKLGASGVLKAAKIAKPVVPILTSKAGKFATAGAAAVGGFGAINPDNSMASVNPEILIKATKQAAKFGELAPTIKTFSADVMQSLGRAANAVEGVVINGPESLHTFMRNSLENTAGAAILDRQVKALEPVNDMLMKAGHDALNLPETAGRSVRDVFNSKDIVRNIEVAKSTHPEAFAAFGLRTAKDIGAHVMENDHHIGTSFVTWLIGNRAKNIKGGLTRDWRDEQQALLDWANSGDNMQRVGRLYNQLKASNSPEQALIEIKKLEADMAARGVKRTTQLTDEFMGFVADNQTSLINTMGKGIIPEIKAGYKNPSYIAESIKKAADRALK